MEAIIKFLKKNWIKLWIIIVALALSGVATYAVFTRVNIVKRVISTDEGVGDRFSSDFMQSSGVYKMRETKNSQEEIPQVSVHVFNYPYPKSAFYRNSKTTYSLTARLGTMSGDVFTPLDASNMSEDALELLNSGGYKIAYGNDERVFSSTNLTVEFNACEIEAGGAHSNEFILTFDLSEVASETPNEYFMELVANPEDLDLPTLRGYVSVRFSQTASSGWSGKLESLNPQGDYDAFNYILTGTGSGEISFKWKANYVSINKQFLENKNYKFKVNGTQYTGGTSVTAAVNGLVMDGEGYKTITLIVDSTKINRYDVQFFKTGVSGADYINNISDYIPSTEGVDWVAASD